MDFIISLVTGIATSLTVVLIAFIYLFHQALDLKVNPGIRPSPGYKTAQLVTGFKDLQQPVL